MPFLRPSGPSLIECFGSRDDTGDLKPEDLTIRKVPVQGGDWHLGCRGT
jgi:hypothetical protein